MVALPLAEARRPDPQRITLLLLLLMAGVSLLSLGTGAAGLPPARLLAILAGMDSLTPAESLVLHDIRLPRLAMGLMVGAALAVAGALMQGLFRNPLADPGIVGVGAGAGLGAVLAIVLGGLLPPTLAAIIGGHLVPVAAFLGGWIATLILTQAAASSGTTSIATLLLAGIALGAIAGAATGILTFLADDQQLRDLTFWSMGSLAGASWAKITTALLLILPVLALSPLLARALNALALGERRPPIWASPSNAPNASPSSAPPPPPGPPPPSRAVSASSASLSLTSCGWPPGRITGCSCPMPPSSAAPSSSART